MLDLAARKSISLTLVLLIAFSCVACSRTESSEEHPPSQIADGGSSAVSGSGTDGDTDGDMGGGMGGGTGVPDGSPPTAQNSNEGEGKPDDLSETASPGGAPAVQTPGQDSSQNASTDKQPSPSPAGTPEEAADSGAATAQTATPTPTHTPALQDEEPVVLTIRGDGVSGETTWTLGQLQALSGGYREYKYSTTNNWPSFGYMKANGISLPYLLRQAGLKSGAAGFRLISTDGYYINVTYDQVFGSRYAYSNHSASGSSGVSAVEPIIAWEHGESTVRPEKLRPFFGQRGPMEVNTSTFVKDLYQIEALTASAGSWAAPNASTPGGSVVSSGAELILLHDSVDNIRIYYTLDGSEPDYNSLVYNRSASYFQPNLNAPIVLTHSLTIKAFAAGFGRDPSPVATFKYTVE